MAEVLQGIVKFLQIQWRLHGDHMWKGRKNESNVREAVIRTVLGDSADLGRSFTISIVKNLGHTENKEGNSEWKSCHVDK